MTPLFDTMQKTCSFHKWVEVIVSQVLANMPGFISNGFLVDVYLQHAKLMLHEMSGDYEAGGDT
jgi:hypothetical protein